MSEHMKRCLLATVAHLLLLLSSPLNSASAYENIDGSVPSIHHDGHKTPFLGDEGPGTTHSSTSDDDFEWMRIVPHSIDASDVSRSGESPSNDDPDFVEQLLQTSGGTRSRTRSPTFGPSRQTMTTSSKTPTQTSPPWRSAMPTERASAMPTRGEVTAIDVDATQVVTTASPTASSSPIATAGEPAGIPTPRSTESPAAVNATASSDNSESQISSSHVTVKPTGIPQVVTTASPTAASSPIATTGEPTGIPTPRSMEPSAAVNATASSENNERPISSSHDATTGKPAGIVTTSSTSPSDVDSSLNDREHDRDGHESNNDDGTPNNNAEVMGGEEDDVVRVDVPRIICDMTMSPSLFRQTSERNRVLATTMTDTMRDLFDAHLRRASYDLRNISLAVEVKWNEDEYLLDGAARVHAHYRGSVSFSSGPTPTRDDLIKFLVRYFDVYDFADRWMLHAGYRDDDVSSVAAVNSVHFVLEDGTLIRAGGIEYEENELPNDATDAPTGRGMQVSLLIGVIGKKGSSLLIFAHPSRFLSSAFETPTTDQSPLPAATVFHTQ
jgi:hypothetical protein